MSIAPIPLPTDGWSLSFYDFVRSRQHIRRNRQIDLLGGFEIDDELELHRLLDGEIRRLGTFENFVHVVCGASETLSIVGRVGHKATSLYAPNILAHRS